MALIDDIKLSLRVTTDALDAEVQMLIDAAIYDMERVGVNPDLLGVYGDVNSFVKTAITAYCKANFGYDVTEAYRFDDAYRRIVCDLLNSAENVAAMGGGDDGLEGGSADVGFGLGSSPKGGE